MARTITVGEKRGKLKVFAAAFAIIVFMLAHVGVQMYIMNLENRVRDVMGRREVMENEVKALEVRVADLSRAGRIKNMAREKLGMFVPEGAPRQLY